MSADPPAAERPTVAVRFMLDADAAPGLLSRLLQPFARRDLIPDRMWSHRSAATMHVEIAVTAMPEDAVHLVEGNLRQVVGVCSVTRTHEPVMRRAA
jgi:acetolactate synthase regulatory subunit